MTKMGIADASMYVVLKSQPVAAAQKSPKIIKFHMVVISNIFHTAIEITKFVRSFITAMIKI